MKFIECEGTPLEMGKQYGEAARDEIVLSMELWKSWFSRYPVRKAFVAEAAAILEQYAPEVLEELRGMAAAAGVPEEFLLAVNSVDTFGNESERCTPLLLRYSSRGVIVAKNNDAPPEERFPFILRKGVPAHGLPFLQVTYAGWLSGLDMMNAEGLANTHGSVGSVFPKSGRRLDIRLRSYVLMRRCRSSEAFIGGLREVPLTGKGFSIALGDASADTAFIDAAVPEIAVRDRGREFDWSANLYRAPGLENADMRPPDRKRHCLARGEYLSRLKPPSGLADVEALLRDHSSPCAPCRHGGQSGAVTVWSMVCLPEKRLLRVASGSPCNTPYQEYTL